MLHIQLFAYLGVRQGVGFWVDSLAHGDGFTASPETDPWLITIQARKQLRVLRGCKKLECESRSQAAPSWAGPQGNQYQAPHRSVPLLQHCRSSQQHNKFALSKYNLIISEASRNVRTYNDAERHVKQRTPCSGLHHQWTSSEHVADAFPPCSLPNSLTGRAKTPGRVCTSTAVEMQHGCLKEA